MPNLNLSVLADVTEESLAAASSYWNSFLGSLRSLGADVQDTSPRSNDENVQAP